MEFLEIFLRDLLLNESVEMRDRDMHISRHLGLMNKNGDCDGRKE